MSAGFVHLVGAGPGAADLLGLRALRRIEVAEVLVHDRLISAEIMALLPDSAERIDVGKSAGRHPVPQEEIHAILIQAALAGRQVLRLKGGDPCVFRRAVKRRWLLVRPALTMRSCLVSMRPAASGQRPTAALPLPASR